MFIRLTTNSDNVPTEAEVRASLAADEAKEAQAAQAPVYGTSMSAFLVAGFQLEDLQYVDYFFFMVPCC